jgi:hypothetical protein
MKVDKNYHAYLIRFKRRETQPGWRATLENVHTRETRTFATERELLLYLLQILSEHPGSRGSNADPGIGTES